MKGILCFCKVLMVLERVPVNEQPQRRRVLLFHTPVGSLCSRLLKSRVGDIFPRGFRRCVSSDARHAHIGFQ